MPLISVIVPVHNSAHYLCACLDSLVSQGPDIEIVMADDASTDEGPSIIAGYINAVQSGKSPTIIYTRRASRGGPGAARNMGLDHASGEYILFVDSDDYLADGAIGKIAKVIKWTRNPDVVVCRYRSENKILSNDDLFASFLGAELNPPLFMFLVTQYSIRLDHCWPYVIRHDLIKRRGARFDETLTIAEDTAFIVPLLAHARSMTYYSGDCYTYRQRVGSQKTTTGHEAAASYLKVAHTLSIRASDEDEHQTQFLTTQSHFASGASASRLAALSDDELDKLMESKLESSWLTRCPCAYRDLINSVTIDMLPKERTLQDKLRPIYIYCSGPGAFAVVKAAQRAGYNVPRVIDDSINIVGSDVAGIPIVGSLYLNYLSPEERDAMFIVICNQDKKTGGRIIDRLVGTGLRTDQIIQRIF